MSSSEIFPSTILIALILITGYTCLHIYTYYHSTLMVFTEVNEIKSFFKELVNTIYLGNTISRIFSFRYGVLEFTVDGFQALTIANETIFSNFMIILRYVCYYTIYPYFDTIIEHGNYTYFSYLIIGNGNCLTLYLRPVLTMKNNSLFIGAVIFDITSSMKIVNGKYLFKPIVNVVNRIYNFFKPLNIHLIYSKHSYRYGFNVSQNFPIALSCTLILVKVLGG
ncbi:MAG: hypothetical protein NZ926_00895 [Candidatus Methanomethylicia archaeon]|nr:hypothetical protein [Candidatus Methanomethylicia archaeon]MCX8168988.1 hypothetical protein [Candidatus Methanomethylicia archaeon]MDW7988720.1 hypothetical protein [Nitrososphaerota archaeon]